MHDRNKIAKEIIEWAKKPDSINLNAFCTEHDPLLAPPMIVRWTYEDENFRQAYDIARAFIGARREKMLNEETLHVKAYDLNAAVYDYFLKQEQRDQAKFESDLRKEEAELVTEKQKIDHEKICSAIDQQLEKSAKRLQEKESSSNV